MNWSTWQPVSPSVTAETFYDTLANSPAAVLHFWAVWEKYSWSLDVRLQQLRPVLAPQVDFYSVDVDEEANWQVCSRYNIQTTPTLLFFINGNLRDNFVGLRSIIELEDRLRLWQKADYEPA